LTANRKFESLEPTSIDDLTIQGNDSAYSISSLINFLKHHEIALSEDENELID